MRKQELICTCCPMGCPITVVMEQGEVVKVTGNTCRRGDIYARKEVISPTRIVTTTVAVEGGSDPVVSVKTQSDIPKAKIMDCVRELKQVKVKAPVYIGDLIVRNIADTGVDVIATRTVE